MLPDSRGADRRAPHSARLETLQRAFLHAVSRGARSADELTRLAEDDKLVRRVLDIVDDAAVRERLLLPEWRLCRRGL